MEYLFQLQKQFNLSKLQIECALLPVVGFSTSPVEITVFTSVELSESEQDDLLALLNSHSSSDITEHIRKIIRNAVMFGTDLMEEFAAENVMSGITQAGKTKQVADYLADVIRYVQTGSLYEVINEVDRLIAAGIPPELDPFVTQDILNNFKSRVLVYLQG
jgi:hypothetical protein